MSAIEVHELTKRFGAVTAVEDLSFTVEPGRVTGFLGPNGAGKSTTLRILLGLHRPTSGSATFGGMPYAQLSNPARTVGAVLEVGMFHPGRRAQDHLRILAAGARIPPTRVKEVLDLVDLGNVGRGRIGGFSLGMRQRLGLAGALLGDPEILVLDEPTNGLDPEGVHWLRAKLRALAGEGRTVLVSSHLLAEVQQTVDDVVVIDRSRLVVRSSLDDLVLHAASAGSAVTIRTPQANVLRSALQARGLDAASPDGDTVVVTGASSDDVGRAIATAGVVVYEMHAANPTLEDVFFELTRDAEGSPR